MSHSLGTLTCCCPTICRAWDGTQYTKFVDAVMTHVTFVMSYNTCLCCNYNTCNWYVRRNAVLARVCGKREGEQGGGGEGGREGRGGRKGRGEREGGRRKKVSLLTKPPDFPGQQKCLSSHSPQDY